MHCGYPNVITVLADGIIGELTDGFECPKGKAWMAMKTWTSSTHESVDTVKAIGEQIGFEVTGKVEVYETEPKQPPSDKPNGYDINFTHTTNKKITNFKIWNQETSTILQKGI